ncbi:hypothetical protein [Ruegeria sp. A3M17]|uniref:hypothetical protein n=1 Tax=Ruegeria sp. A3M17 TaxID=2267229 RepID=UPI0011BE0438|nr:hypothetical protein [Ruegeria sp. A3M17]
MGNATADVDVTQYWIGLLGAYRVLGGTDAAGRKRSFDLSAGVRYNSLKQTVAISGGPGPGANLGGTEAWWEPVIGARYAWQINDRWTGGASIDAGGFGVNGDDLQWSATLGADYSLGDRGSIKLGLRYYSIDYSTTRSDGEFAYDVDQFGPFIGYTLSF